jgi:hypothetical protein
MTRLFLCPLLLAILLAGCTPWHMVGGRYAEGSFYEVDLPDGWRRYGPGSESLVVTRDGLALQQISIDRRANDKDLPHTKKKLAKGMLPQEMAEIIIDDIRSNNNIRNQQILENAPAKIAGYPGFKLVYAFETGYGLKKEGTYYAFMEGDTLYGLLYEAPARYYFAKDLPTFDKIKDSFKLVKKGGG